ncbi:thiamine phosphate synthase [Rhodohalobacter sulfatireducens]|uniref:Thiamine phosphate synthase n=1 Tax=Rhodohalobacter sulfatireducens TaxID=2911366 RepID=A0ABS9KJA0_9BACT|nr:thiamine phosphate synthase [Rhodohalobacter sulfatireducens]MCG2590927.1 thiamine phosphate synthase [Rhodohalobacter sulfatireducens]
MMKKEITGGIYLVLDPSINKTELLEKLEQALNGGVDIIQIWNNWPESISHSGKVEFIEEILDLTKRHNVPVLMNNDWKMLKETDMDGVHLDQIPEDYDQIQSKIQRDFIAGITCSNNLEVIQWAENHDIDYISFCSMFPSNSVDSCEIVRTETVRKAREITDIPLFVSGGITPKNLSELDDLDFQGVAVISGILTSDSPRIMANEYKKKLKNKVPLRRVKERQSRSGG